MKYLLLVPLFFLPLRYASAQQQPAYHPIDHEAWEKAVKGIDYNETPPEAKEPDTGSSQDNTRPSRHFSLQSTYMKVILYSLIVILLLYIILRVTGKDIFARKKNSRLPVHIRGDLEEQPMESDLQRFLREAVERRDYRMAVRIYYLLVLKTLQDKNLIIWKKNKTNSDYLADMYSHSSWQKLRDYTRMYETIWYGQVVPDAAQFENLSAHFTQLLNEYI